jgi:shikimate kinase
MSMSGSSAEPRQRLVERILQAVDPRLVGALREELRQPGAGAGPAPGQTVVLAGHRAAGKTRLLPLVGALLGRPGVDLDAELERRSGRPLRSWVAEDPQSFRRAERATFLEMPPGGLVAVGGGFLSHHPEALAGCFTLLVPISFETYRERLLADSSRPRLRPDVTLEEEIASLFHQREALHARVPTVSLAGFLRAFMSPGGSP